MGTILIRCPATEAYVSTGVQMDYITFFDTDFGPRQTLCSECGEMHRWAQNDAWFKDVPEQERASS